MHVLVSRVVLRAMCSVLSLPLVVLTLYGCSASIPLGPEKVWTSDPRMESALAPPVRIDDFKVRPPMYYATSDNSSDSSKRWKDTQQPASRAGTTPIAPGSSEMVQCETDNVPHELSVNVEPTARENNQQNLSDICKETINKVSLPVETKNFKQEPVEFGTIKGLRFCKGAWSADIPTQRRLPGVSMNVPVPAQGLCYVTIANGRALIAEAKVPKGDPALATLEQSMLSIESATGTTGGSPGTSAAASVTSPRQLFDTFKRLDLANDPRIIDLYADDANINVLGTPYSRPAYAAFIAGSYKLAPNVNAMTQYSEPVFDNETGDSAHVTFTCTAAGATVDMDWTLRRNAKGVWQIATERSKLRQ